MDIKDKYVQLLEMNNTTNYKVAKSVGISETALRQFKKGKINLKVDKLEKIGKHFNVPLSYFIDNSESEFIIPEQDLITKYHKLSKQEQEILNIFIDSLLARKNKQQ